MLIYGHFPNGEGGLNQNPKVLGYFCCLIFDLSFGQYLGGGGWLNLRDGGLKLFQKFWGSFEEDMMYHFRLFLGSFFIFPFS